MSFWDILTYTLFKLGDLKIAIINIAILLTLVVASRFLIKRFRKRLRDYLINKKLRLEDKKITLIKLLGQAAYFFAFVLSIESLRINNLSTDFDGILGFNLITIGSFSFGLSHIFDIIVVLFVAKILVNVLMLAVRKGSVDKELELDQGTQFVVIQLLKYTIYIFAGIIILKNLGVNLTLLMGSSAALLLGIGFGLQDLFRDVISGFILLFEGTIKVGDIIEIPNAATVDNHNAENMVAKVLKINIRTTKIKTRDGNTLIIPNSILTREFVNNWTYSSKLTRFNIAFSVAYSSDVEKVKEIVENVVSSHRLVKRKGSIYVRILNFGDNGVEMDVLFWADQTWMIEIYKSDIRFEIFKLFRENNIEIPFPQRVISYPKKDVNKEHNLDELKKDI